MIRFDKIFFVLFLFSIISLAYVAGIASLHYKFDSARIVEETIEAVEKEFEDEEKAANSSTFPGNSNDVQGTIDNVVKRAAAKITLSKNANKPKHYTMLTVYHSNTVYLVDQDGNTTHSWRIDKPKALSVNAHTAKVKRMPEHYVHLDRARVMPDGDLLVGLVAFNQTPYGKGLVRLDKDSNIKWMYKGNVHHAFHVNKSNGHIFVLTHDFVDNAPKGLSGLYYPMLADYVVELSPEGKELNKVSILEALGRSQYKSLLYKYWNRSKTKGKWDHLHSNSVMVLEPQMSASFPQFKAGQVMVSIRNLNALVILDMEKEIVTRSLLGNWRRQHSASFLDNGNILLFDNRGYIYANKQYSRIMEINSKTSGVVWSYASTDNPAFHTGFYGGTQRLRSGNTLITDSLQGRIFEVTSKKKVVWDYKLAKYSHKTVLAEKQRTNKETYPHIIDAHRYEADELPFLRE